jgi:hypothetical protein
LSHQTKSYSYTFLIARWQTTRPLIASTNAIASAIGYAKHRSRSHDAVIRVYDEAGDVIETHEHAGEFKEW